MRLNRWFTVAAIALMARGACAAGDEARQTNSIDADWHFHLGEAAGAVAPGFSDAGWRTLDVPHDWSIEGQIEASNRSGAAQAYLPMGVGWYRKTFDLPVGAAGKRVFIEFDGVTMDSTCYINGEKLGERPNGYSSFRYDLTGHLKDSGNLLAVHVDNSLQPSSRWYAGSGITRHVRLIVTDSVHIGQWATYITTPKVSGESATVHLETAVENQGTAAREAGVQVEILAPDGKSVKLAGIPAQTIAPGKSQQFSTDIVIDRPQLWGTDTPVLYQAAVRVRSGDRTIDNETTPFGIRTAEFRPETGFWLNGKNIKLQGVCLHNDGGGVGAAVPMGVWERRLDILRSLGVNAIRTSHNPPDPAFLSLLDRKGFLVMHEIFDCWTTRKTPGDYARFFSQWWERDLTDAVMRDRNHPCIVIYSAGNEIHDSMPMQLQVLPKLRDAYHRLDPTRPVTLAILQPERTGAFTNGLAEMLDVVGCNYRPTQLVALAKEHPGMKVIETETNYGAGELPALRDNPSLSGEMLWTGIDYLGEGRGNAIAAGSGLIDRTNAPRARAYEHAAWWSGKPLVKIARSTPAQGNRGGRGAPDAAGLGGSPVSLDWTPAELTAHPENVTLYSNCDEVELFLNGKSLGRERKTANYTHTISVDFAPGTIKAIGYNDGKEVASDELATAGKPAQLTVTADEKALTTAWDDVAYVRVNVADDKGVTNPISHDEITFTLSGPGTIMAVDNADLESHESFRGDKRHAYRGTCIAVIKATGAGPITIKASAAGLADGSVTIEGK